MFRNGCVTFLILSFLPSFLLAEPPLAQRLPTEDFSHIGVAKIEKVSGKNVVAVKLPAWRRRMVETTYTVQVPVTKTVTEEVSENGKTTAVKRQVTELETETRTGLFPEFTPRAPVQSQLAIKGLKAWNRKGKLLSEAELLDALANTSYILCLMEEPDKEVLPLDPFMASALRSDLIVLFSKELTSLYFTNVEEIEN